MKYNIGDKVRITVQGTWTKLVGEVCEVYQLTDSDSEFACRVRHLPTNWDCLMLDCEIEIISTRGQQLLLFEL